MLFGAVYNRPYMYLYSDILFPFLFIGTILNQEKWDNMVKIVWKFIGI